MFKTTGLLGFFGSVDASSDANVGLLDARFAADWVRENIGKFGKHAHSFAIFYFAQIVLCESQAEMEIRLRSLVSLEEVDW